MANSLEQQLINGGLTAAAAKAIANAIGNLATSQQKASTQLVDGTPSKMLRMVDGESRRSYFTNLDQPQDKRFADRLQANVEGFAQRETPHSYDSAEPRTTTSRLNAASIVGGPFVNVDTRVQSEVQQSRVSLDVQGSGRHLRLGPSRDHIEAVNFTASNDTEARIANEFVERGGETVLLSKARGLSSQDVVLADGTTMPCSGWFNTTPPLAQIFSAFVKNNVLNATDALDFADGFIQYGTFRPYYSVAYSSAATLPVLPDEAYESDIGGGNTRDSRAGYYIRIGDFVQCWGRIRTRSTAATGGAAILVPTAWESLSGSAPAGVTNTLLTIRGFPFKYKHTSHATSDSVNRLLYAGRTPYVFNFRMPSASEWLETLYIEPDMAGSANDQQAQLINMVVSSSVQSISSTPAYAIHSGAGLATNQVRQTDLMFNVAYSTQDLDQYA